MGMNRWLAALCLLAVAVLSGLIWWLIRHDPTSDPAAGSSSPGQTEPADSPGTPGVAKPTAPNTIEAGQFTFNSAAAPRAGDDCAEVSYGEVRDWFADHPCDRVVRGLYTADAGEARAIVSIIVVTMPTDGQAGQLKELTDTSGTGNVSDMLRDGTASVPNAPNVSGVTYASNASGNNVTIIEAAFFPGGGDTPLLEQIAAEAIRAATQLR